MKSARSYFDAGVFLKTVRRFWPVWGLYGFAWLIALPLSLIGQFNRYGLNLSADVLQTVELTACWLCPVAACAAAMAGFSHLYNERAANFYASLPVRREGMFVSCAAAGLLPLLAVNAAVALVTLLAELAAGYTGVGAAVAQWFAAVTLECVAYFGMAALCALLTGHIVIMPLLFAALNCAGYAIASLAVEVQSIFCYGFAYPPSDSYSLFSPFVAILDNVRAEFGSVSYLMPARLEGWGWLLGYGALGALLLPLALVCYKRRNMESAGDVVAIAPLAPAFKFVCSLAAAFALGSLLYNILMGTRGSGLTQALLYSLCMAAGAFIGWFGAEMLVNKSFDVFGPRRFAGWAAVGLLCAAFVFGCELDVTGYERRIPDAEDVACVSVRTNEGAAEFESPEDIELLRGIHVYAAENRPNGSVYLQLDYRLKSGDHLRRSYGLASYGQPEPLEALNALMNRPEVIIERLGAPESVTSVGELAVVYYRDEPFDSEETTGVINQLELTPEEAAELYNECVYPDLLEGRLGLVWFGEDGERRESVYDCTIEFRSSGSHRYIQISPTVMSGRTSAWLEAHGVPLLTLAESGAAVPFI